MEMNQVVKQRVNIIAGHLAAGATPEDISAISTHIFPMSCSNSLNTVIPRGDNRTFFARQGSSAQAGFMKQVSTDQTISSNSLNSANWRCDNKLFFARQASSAQGFFMRQISSEQGSQSQPDIPLKSPYCANKANSSFEAPVFSRPAQADASIQNVGGQETVIESVPEALKFARPNRVGGDSWSYTKERTPESKWSPRMDVAEYGSSYVIAIELPGVSADDIRVEVSEQNLTVTGNRSAQISEVASYSNDSISAFHKKEIFLGPYQVVWSIPNNTDKDRVSADFANGLLRITIPKLLENSSKVMKANM